MCIYIVAFLKVQYLSTCNNMRSRNSSVTIRFTSVTIWSAWQSSLTTLSRFSSAQIGSVFLNIFDAKMWSSSCYCHLSFCRESIVSSLFWYDLCPFEVSIAHADPLLNENFSLKYYKATTFVESSFLENCSLCFSGLFSSCKELSRTLGFLEKEIHFAFWRYLYFS